MLYTGLIMKNKRTNNKLKIASANLLFSFNKNAQVIFNNAIETIAEKSKKMKNETNTCLENVSNNNKDQLKLRDFNDLKKEDVITTVKMLVASKKAEKEMTIYPSANVDKKHYSINEDDINEIQSKYEDDESDLSRDLASYLNDELRHDYEMSFDIDEIVESSEIETEIKEISVDEAVRTIDNIYCLSEIHTDIVTDENKKSLLSKLKLSLDDYAVELVLKDNVKTFVIVKEKNILNEIEETRDYLNMSFSETLDFHKKLDNIMLELYDEDRSMYDSLKVFFERLDSELDIELDSHLHMQEEDLIEDLRKQFETLKSKSESSNQ